MARREFVALKCYEGSRPTMRLKVYNLLGREFEISFLIDTGFDGPLMLDNSSYEKFKAGELPEEEWFRYRTLNGYLVMKTARAFLEINGSRLETYVMTPRDFEGKNLVGLHVLRRMSLAINKGSETCVITEKR